MNVDLVYVNIVDIGLHLSTLTDCIRGDWALSEGGKSSARIAQTFLFFKNVLIKILCLKACHMNLVRSRPLKRTLELIYDAARKGLKGDALALAAGMLPVEYRRLVQFDPIAEYAEIKGRADGEAEMAGIMRDAALAGDTKAALEILKHVHKWTAPQSVQVQVEQRISILAALEEAQTRVIEGIVLDNTEAVDAGTSDGLLTNRNEDGGYEPTYTRNSEIATDL